MDGSVLPRFLTTGLLLLMVGLCRGQVIPAEDDEPFKVRLLGQQEDLSPRPGPFKILGLEDRPDLRDSVEETAFEARGIIRSSTNIDWEGTAFIVWVEEEEDFLNRTGFRPEHIAAAASPARSTVWINSSAWRRSVPSEQLRTMTHEIGHLLVGSLEGGGGLPRWAQEGLVMHLADQWTLDESLAVARAHLFGQMPALADLEESFPTDPEGQRLAYDMSYLAVGQVAQAYGDFPGQVTRLMRRLADEEAGPEVERSLWDPGTRDSWNRAALETIGGKVTTALIVITSGTTIWILILVLGIWVWILKKRRRAAADRREEEQEAWAASLSRQDIEDVWGKREEDAEEKDEEDLHPWEKWEKMKGEEEERW